MPNERPDGGTSQDLLERALRAIDEDPDALVAVVGPTASGKTELAVSLADQLGGEIVSADSVQVYRGFDVGSGKPTAEERARAPHHLVSAIEPLDPFDAALYADAAGAAMRDISTRGKRPIVAGGTFLWVKAILFGLAKAPPADKAIRARHREEAARQGHAALHAKLVAADPLLAARLHPNDLVRVSRGLEVHELTGCPLSVWQSNHGFREARHRPLLLAIQREPAALTARIDRRVDRWLATGWIEEVRDLQNRGYGSARAMGAVGYREVTAHLAGEIPREDLAGAIVRATRVFARRQRTWLNHEPVRWLGERSAG
jgi:tRNA dimethylallyltransferase